MPSYYGTQGDDVFVGQDGSGDYYIQGYAEGSDPALETGNDVLHGGSSRDIILGGGGNDKLYGRGGQDELFGQNGDDHLYGGGSADYLDGGAGNDTFWLRGNDDGIPIGGPTFVGSTGTDTVALESDVNISNLRLGTDSGVEILDTKGFLLHGGAGDQTFDLRGLISVTGTVFRMLEGRDVFYGYAGADSVFGDGGEDWLEGQGGNDRLDGGTGSDTLIGGAGNDTYVVDSSGDIVDESVAGSSGRDTVLSSISFSLGNARGNLENLTLTGSVDIAAAGNKLANVLTGNAGANVLHDGGVGGADRLSGLAGNDTYIVYNAGDIIVEAASHGTADRVSAGVDYRLGAGVHVEAMATTSSGGKAGIDLTGNEFAQSITGNAGANRLEGKGGNDTLRGLGGADTFVFATALGSGNVDTIADFNAVDDRFLLSDAIFKALSTGTLSAAAFRANTTGLAQDSSDRIIYETDTGELYYDANGSAAGGGILFARLTGLPTITHADFSVA